MLKHFLYQDKQIFYRLEGSGQPVVLLHGFGEDSNIWNEQIDFLKDHCLLIIPDLPGSGHSELLVSSFKFQETSNRKPETITIEDYAEVIHQLLVKENISSCIMLGHSMGGYITLAFAEMFPPLLSALGLIHSTAFADSEEKKTNRLKGIELMEEYGAYSFLKNTIPNLFSASYKEAYPDKIASLIEAGKEFTTEACVQYYCAMMNRPDRTHILTGNPLPVLFVIGTEDVAIPLKDSMQQMKLPQKAYIHILENVGHMGIWEAAEKVNDFILSFIEHCQ
jgi:pimeloyl-ACP methyl ester carboxylesterase